jgi:putative hydrolases of HD superfamily
MSLPPNLNCKPRLAQQIAFILEVDKVKHILRKSKLFDGSRFENDAEHSWTICMMAMLLREYANFQVDMERVLKMLLIHDIVEIDAGDTFLYSKDRHNAAKMELQAAERIFGLLPVEQSQELIAIWKEFEAQQSNEAKFAAVFDRLEPLLQNYMTQGFTWKANNVTYDMVIKANTHIKDGSAEIWQFVLHLLEESVKAGYLASH